MRKNNANKETIIGRIFDNSLELKVTGATSKNPNTPYIQGELNIAIDEDGINVIPVNFTYVTEIYSKSKKKNPNFAILKDIMENPEKTWVKGGKDNAYKIKIENSAFSLNDFYVIENQKIVSSTKNEGGFLTILSELPEEKDRSSFEFDAVITKAEVVEADPEKNIPEEYVKLKAILFDYTNRILPTDLIVKSKGGQDYFLNADISSKNPLYTKVWGQISNRTIIKEKTTETAFGDNVVTSSETHVREWIINKAAKVPYEFGDESVLTVEELKKAMQDREIHLSEVKQNRLDYEAKKQTSNDSSKSAESAFSTTVANGDFDF